MSNKNKNIKTKSLNILNLGVKIGKIMKKRVAFQVFALMILLLFTMTFVQAFSLKDVLKFTKIQKDGKNISKMEGKDDNNIILKEKIPEETDKDAINAKMKEIPPQKTSALYGDSFAAKISAKNVETQSKLQVINEKQIKVVGNANTVCFNPIDKIVSVPEDETSASAKEYEFNTARGECNADGREAYADPGIKIECNYGRAMWAHCAEGSIINYGGICSLGNTIAYLGPPIGSAYRSSGFVTGWSNLPRISEVFLSCTGGTDSSKSIILTCMREKT